MAEPISMKLLLEAGVHFGHQVARWNPKMKSYIFSQRNGIHIIDLEQTVVLLGKACDFVRQVIESGEDIICGYQEAGTGGGGTGGTALRHVLCQSALAGWNDDQLRNHSVSD